MHANQWLGNKGYAYSLLTYLIKFGVQWIFKQRVSFRAVSTAGAEFPVECVLSVCDQFCQSVRQSI